jgi:effector-binding domain-containing protein
MIDTPHLTETADQLTAVLHLTVPRGEIQNVMGPGLSEVMAAVMARGLTPAGPWFTHHLRRPADTFDFEIGVPVQTPLTATGRVTPGLWPAMRLARTVYHGGYEGLAAAWGEFLAWVKGSGHTPSPDLWERYLVGPETSPDPADWRTELNQPLEQAVPAPR